MALAGFLAGALNAKAETFRGKVGAKMSLTPAASLDAMVASPAGHYVSGAHFLFICQSESLYATFVWGRPGAEASRHLIAALATEVRPAARPHRSLIDFSDLTSVDIDAFNTLRAFIERVKPLQAKLTQREAVIRPGGIAGTVVAGFYLLYPPPYLAKVFTRYDDAVAWLGEVDELTLRSWLALRDQVRGTCVKSILDFTLLLGVPGITFTKSITNSA